MPVSPPMTDWLVASLWASESVHFIWYWEFIFERKNTKEMDSVTWINMWGRNSWRGKHGKSTDYCQLTCFLLPGVPSIWRMVGFYAIFSPSWVGVWVTATSITFVLGWALSHSFTLVLLLGGYLSKNTKHYLLLGLGFEWRHWYLTLRFQS